MAEIAAGRDLTLSTVENHLAEAIEAGEKVDIDRLIDEEKLRAIEAAIADLGPEPLRPVMDRLGAGYTYGELRIVRAWLQTGRSDVGQ